MPLMFRRTKPRINSETRDMDSRAEISIFALNFPPEATGIAPYTGSLAAGLSEAGFRVTAHVGPPHYPEWKIRDGYKRWVSRDTAEGVEVWRRRHYIPAVPRGLRRLLSELSFGLRLIGAAWRRPPLVIAVSPPLFAVAIAVLRIRASRSPTRLIVWVQDLYSLGLEETGEGGRVARQVTRLVESWTLRAADRVVVIHQGFSDYLQEKLGVGGNSIRVIKNWTHLAPMEPVDSECAKRHLGWDTHATLAVHTGNMGAKQGLDNVIDAARLAAQTGAAVRFILIGDGSERKVLEDYARGIPNVSFVDPLPDYEYRMALAAADVLIVNEKLGVSGMAVPSKLTSYFSAGRPIVGATDLTGITAAEIATSGAGLIVPAGDAHALLHAVLELKEQPDIARRQGENGRRYCLEVLEARAAISHWADLCRTLIDSDGLPLPELHD